MPVDRSKKKVQGDAVPLGEAIRRARGKMRQTDLAAAVGTDQTTISKWENGVQRPTLDDLKAIDEKTGHLPGYVLRAAGYVVDPATSEEAVANDPRLNPQLVPVVLGALAQALLSSEAER